MGGVIDALDTVLDCLLIICRLLILVISLTAFFMILGGLLVVPVIFWT